jgi:hypothetical protein
MNQSREKFASFRGQFASGGRDCTHGMGLVVPSLVSAILLCADFPSMEVWQRFPRLGRPQIKWFKLEVQLGITANLEVGNCPFTV